MSNENKRIAVSPAEAGEMLGVHISTIYKLVGRKQLKLRKVGRASRILISEIHELLENSVYDPEQNDG